MAEVYLAKKGQIWVWFPKEGNVCKVTTSTTAWTHHALKLHDIVTAIHVTFLSFWQTPTHSSRPSSSVFFCVTSINFPRYSHSLSPCSHSTLQITYLYHRTSMLYTEYSSPLNNMGLNYAGPLIHNFLQYCTVNVFSIPKGFINNIFSLAHFVKRTQYIKHTIQNMC